MKRVFRSAAVAWSAAAVMACATTLSFVPSRAPAVAVSQTPHWVLPQERARAHARSQGRPLLIVSLNGNLDGYC